MGRTSKTSAYTIPPVCVVHIVDDDCDDCDDDDCDDVGFNDDHGNDCDDDWDGISREI